MKHLYCANCGQELTLIHKALPKQGRTIMVILPHKCLEETANLPFKDINNELITYKNDSKFTTTPKNDDGFKFAQKLNDLGTAIPTQIGDKRLPEDITQNIPLGISKAIKDLKRG